MPLNKYRFRKTSASKIRCKKTYIRKIFTGSGISPGINDGIAVRADGNGALVETGFISEFGEGLYVLYIYVEAFGSCPEQLGITLACGSVGASSTPGTCKIQIIFT